jgi:hypothetical protein
VKDTDIELINSLPEEKLAFDKDIKPILEKRCIVCHGCYDAPCQLKLTSFEGMDRGANKWNVYNEPPLVQFFTYKEPTRLFIDAKTTEEWRDKDFFGILNEDKKPLLPRDNLKNSLLYQMLSLKEDNPLPKSGKLPRNPENLKDDTFFDVRITRKQTCSTLDEFGNFRKQHPDWGMPYALPGLSKTDRDLLVRWIAQGTKWSDQTKQSLKTEEEIKDREKLEKKIELWENFFNAGKESIKMGNDDKGAFKKQLVSRYIYEHLVLGHLHFNKAPEGEFFRLVRSRTEKGDIDEIATVRPYDDPTLIKPKVKEWYYRLLPYKASIVDKNHIVYELSEDRMTRYKELFIQPSYVVENLPIYYPGVSSNYIIRALTNLYKSKFPPPTPFEIFYDIPIESRYKFLLDDARFFINGFIKGPVCRGQRALGSIEDQFWVFFLKPENPSNGVRQHGLDRDFLRDQEEFLHLPTEIPATQRPLRTWTEYWQNEQKYTQAKLGYYIKPPAGKKILLPVSAETAVDEFIWSGKSKDGTINQNSALTIFRHLDSASVHYGLHGDEPETAWVLDYPVFERLHYLLVAGFNAYGNLGHRLSARLYMDFLRMEAENNFLFFLPKKERKKIYNEWHKIDRKTTLDRCKETDSWLFRIFKTCRSEETDEWLEVDSVNEYPDGVDKKYALFNLLRGHIGDPTPDSKDLNRCNENDECIESASDKAMQRLADLKGKTPEKESTLQFFPANSYVRVCSKYNEKRECIKAEGAYSVIYNKSYREFEEESFIKETKNRKDMSGDTLTVLKGLAGAYPNFFFDLKVEEVEAFVTACVNIKNEEDFQELVYHYGVRRTNPKFWVIADWFQEQHTQEQKILAKSLDQPVETGILDLSRYRDL